MTPDKDKAIKILRAAMKSITSAASVPVPVLHFAFDALAATSQIAPDDVVQAEPCYVLRFVTHVGGPLGDEYGLVRVSDWDAGMSRAISEQVCGTDKRPLVAFRSPAIAPEASELPPLPHGFCQSDFGPHSAGAVAAMMAKYARAAIAMHQAAAAKPDAHPDDIAVDCFAVAMKAKMAASRAKGRGGWNDPAVCPTVRLQAMLIDHLPKGDPVDVGNFAMMLFNRGERTTSWRTVPPCAEELAEMRALANGYVKVAAAEPVPTIHPDFSDPLGPDLDEWAEAQRVCDLPLVDEAIRRFIEDQTGDNATCLVREVMRATKPAASEAVGVPGEITYSREQVQKWRDDVAHAASDMVTRAMPSFGEGDWSWLADAVRGLAKSVKASSERETFEEWAVSDDGGWAAALARNPDGHEFDYRNDDVQAEWRAWTGRARLAAPASPADEKLLRGAVLDEVRSEIDRLEVHPTSRGGLVHKGELYRALKHLSSPQAHKTEVSGK